MTQPELIHINWQLFRADGNWHDIGHGIEVMAYPYMAVGAVYMRAKEPLPRGSEAGERSLTQNVDPAKQIEHQADAATEDQPVS